MAKTSKTRFVTRFCAGCVAWATSKKLFFLLACICLLNLPTVMQGQSLPDLVVSYLTTPSTATAGQTVSVSAAVKNQGAGPATTFRLGYYLSKSPVITHNRIYTNDSVVFLGTITNPALNPNQEKSLTGAAATFVVPDDIATGVYYVGIFVDDFFTVTESNETNNGRVSDSGSIFITGRNPRPGVGTFANGYWLVDFNGSYSWNAPPAGDRSYALGQAGDTPIVGDWNGTGLAKAGVFRNGQWILDYDGDGVYTAHWPSGLDRVVNFGVAGDVPVVGDWNGDGRTKIGVYSNGVFLLDYDGDFQWNPAVDKSIGWGDPSSLPVVGDWNGSGSTKIGVYKDGYWFLDYNGNFIWEPGGADKQVAWGWPGAERIVTGDWNGDGRTKLGVINLGFWFLDYDGNFIWEPLGNDKQVGWGWPGVQYVTGDWNNDGRTKIGVVNLGFWFLDYDGNYFWDGGINDIILGWGAPGDTPVSGRW